MKEIECKKCKDMCIIEGAYPRFFAWCENCNTYAEGFDSLEYSEDYIADMVDQIESRLER